MVVLSRRSIRSQASSSSSAKMADKADGSVVLALLQDAFLWACDS